MLNSFGIAGKKQSEVLQSLWHTYGRNQNLRLYINKKNNIIRWRWSFRHDKLINRFYLAAKTFSRKDIFYCVTM